MAAYPAWVLRALEQPMRVLPSPQPAQIRRFAQANTPASEEYACLYCASTGGEWYWRALASPWLVALLEGLCTQLGQAEGVQGASAWLEELEIPPTKRYCVVLARTLLQGVRELENSDG